MSLEPTTLSLLLGGLLVLALLAYGLRDFLRFSFYRTWAISGVVFRESIRRNVLWVTPLAMLAVLLLIQLQDPADEADAIRQAMRSGLFATALVAVIVPLILASTNLPREITNRVIFTLVTKPLTRFELLLGKIIGFARLSAVVLLIMGLFTLALLWVMERRLTSRIEATLQTELPVESRRPYLTYLANQGLLQAQQTDAGDDLQVYAELPADPADDGDSPRYFAPGAYFAAVPFTFEPQLIDRIEADSASRLMVRLRLPWKLEPPDALLPGDPPLGIIDPDRLQESPPPPQAAIQVLDANLESVIAPTSIRRNSPPLPPSPDVEWPMSSGIVLEPDQAWRVAEEARRTGDDGRPLPIYIAVYGITPQYLYGITADSVQIGVYDGKAVEIATLMPAVDDSPRDDILLRTYLGTRGLGLSGPEEEAAAPIGILAFRQTPRIEADGDGLVSIELRLLSERVGGVLDETDDTLLQATVHNLGTGFTTQPTLLYPETGHPVVLRVPAEAVEGGNFDLRLQTLSRGHIVSVSGAGVKLIVDRQPFAFNLAKSLLVLWLLSILVIVAGLTFSTFVSWPVAVTLVVFALLGRWVAQQLGEANESVGRQAAEAMLGAGGDVEAKEAVRVGVDALTDAFDVVTAFLPNMSVFATADVLEQGQLIGLGNLLGAAGVTFAFSLPLLALAYIVLRNKEVAP